MTTWGATEWGAVATAAAGIMALLAAWWTVSATRQAAAENSRLLKEQIELQRTELVATQAALSESNRRDKLHAAYTIFKLAGDVGAIVSNAAQNSPQGSAEVIPRFPPELIAKVEAAYPLQAFLNRENHIGFQMLDAVVHGERLGSREHAQRTIVRINELRSALTPAIVGLPHGKGDRVYGSDGESLLKGTSDAEI